MDETKKYIIEFSEDPHTIRLLKLKNGDKYPVTEFKTVTPYTEPDLDAIRKESYDKCMNEAEDLAYKLYSPKIDEAYQRGLNDAWDAARKIIHMPEADLLNLFTECYSAVCTSVQVFLKYDVSECIEIIRQYEQGKDRQARIEFNCEEIKDVLNTTVKECNVSLDEIAAVLEKMRENK